MDTEHRRIELQSPADLTYITSRIRAAATQKLDLHLPPHPDSSEPDELREKVSELVDAFVAQVLAGLRNNISINGLDVGRGAEGETDGGPMDVEIEEFEPYDEALRQRLADTSRRRDQLVERISKHRRTTPAASAQRFQEQWARDMESLAAGEVERVRVAHEIAEVEVVGVDALKRADQVQRSWERAVEGLGGLKGGLGGTTARLEQASEVVDYLKREGGKKDDA
ncbi:hypothetical protein EJ04DRAFT_508803 [Polyplosphaeria fusca]|uniref:Kinetochore protein mis14 n=1 Tax=Polyplosphaeria fusca TaxID=682080 RepID=A0A9P4R611_9PLEO|nr:hypothetical protein EJ04DRAFT_508803 [Polyplosphaeria fusca]